MPDESAAASEHAIMQQITEPLARLPDDPVGAVAGVEFPIVLRGYDREAVDEYIRRTAQLVAELYASRSPEGAVRRALERVGEQVSSILARAHETAEGLTTQSRSEAEERMMQARAEAEMLERDAHALAAQLEAEARHRAEERERAAELRVQELDTEADRIWAERERIVADVRKLSEELGGIATMAAGRFSGETTDEAAAISGPVTERPSAPPIAGPGDGGPALAEERPDRLAEQAAAEPSPGEAATNPLLAEEEADPLATQEYEGPAAEEYQDPLDTGEYGEVSVAEGGSWSAADDYEFGPEESLTEDAPREELAPMETDEDLADTVEDMEPVALGSSEEDQAARSEQPTSVLRQPRVRVIDLRHLGRERVIGCWQVDDVLIDPGPASCLDVLLRELGNERPRAVLLTHIHLDHAGAAGSLVSHWPDLEVYVHERGAAHLIDPTRLLESASRLYGDDMERLWGEVLAVPEEKLHVIRGGERLLEGRFEVAYTPGHASHHVSYLFGRTAFVGDVGGVRIMPETLIIPPTPPPDIDIEAWHESLEIVRSWNPDRLAMTHFGASDDIEQQLADISERLDTWAALARTEDLDTFVDVIVGEIERGASAANQSAYVQAAPPEQLYAGLERYWQKRDPLAHGSADPESAGVADGQGASHTRASTHAGQSARARRPDRPLD